MERVILGSTTLRVSRIGFGCAAIGGWDYGPTDDATSIGAVRAALDAGVTLFDTADVYGLGHAESLLSRALGRDRHHVTIATKCGVRWDATGAKGRDLSPEYVRRAAEGSLRRLRVDYLDLLQLHWPDPSTPIERTMAAAAALQARGLVRAIGCCNFPSSLVDEAQRWGRLETLQVPLSLLEREWLDCARSCKARHGMSVITYNTLAQGLLTGKFAQDASFQPSDLRSRSRLFAPERRLAAERVLEALRARSRRSGRSATHEAIRWVLARPEVAVALVGARTPEQATENASAGMQGSTQQPAGVP